MLQRERASLAQHHLFRAAVGYFHFLTNSMGYKKAPSPELLSTNVDKKPRYLNQNHLTEAGTGSF